jgi:biopolymer transport protein ExbD
MAKSKRHLLSNEINAGSMADIAFLLLIFFLISTKIDLEKGIFVKLPPYVEDAPPIQTADNNVFSVKVNRDNQVLMEGEIGEIGLLKEKIKTFILNPQQIESLADAPNKAVVALQNDRGTSYKIYLEVYNEIKAAYNELWEAESNRRYGVAYADLPKAAQRTIRSKIPSVISESEPTEF